jgi:hypothetical protein
MGKHGIALLRHCQRINSLPVPDSRKRLPGKLTLLIIAHCCISPARAAPTIAAADLDGDGKAERVVLDLRQKQVLSIWRGRTRLWRGMPQKWKPFNLTLADVDGDGSRDIILGVVKATRYFPKPHNCLYVYGWDGRQVFPKWRGSSLSRPFTDFRLADIDNDREAELISLETMRDGTRRVAVYSWVGFGFGFDWQSRAWKSARLLGVEHGKIVVLAEGRRTDATKQS